jgi:imidazole glycerol-phosphate synthase subunit HisF
MTLKVRVIPCLDVKDGRVVKGVNFVDLRDAGDPVEAASAYDAAGADELCFLDITAATRTAARSRRGRAHGRACFMPLTVGGGVRTSTTSASCCSAGADKVSINTAAVNDRDFVREAAEKFGDQCIVVAIDAKRCLGPGRAGRAGRSSPMAAASRPASTRSTMPARWCARRRRNPAHLDGPRRHASRLRLALTRAIADAVPVPVIASGGVGTLDHLVEGVRDGHASAVLAASIFHFGQGRSRHHRRLPAAQRGAGARRADGEEGLSGKLRPAGAAAVPFGREGGRRPVRAPIYSHLVYDVMPNQWVEIDRPDILIVEGLNVLQTGRLPKDGKAIPFVSDFFDFSVYLDADEEVLERWYVDRFLTLRGTAFRDPKSYFHRYSNLSDSEAVVDGDLDLGAHQPGQSARKHPADAPARRPDPEEVREPHGRRSRAAEAVTFALVAHIRRRPKNGRRRKPRVRRAGRGRAA